MIAQIKDLTGGEEADTDLIRDMVEGETNIRDLLTKMVINEALDNELLEGIKKHAENLARRKARVEARIKSRRALIITAMQNAQIDRHETPEGTVSLRMGAPGVEVTQEADIPSKFFVDQAPKLDMRALLAAVKEVEAENAAILEKHVADGINEPPVLKSIPGAAFKPAVQGVQIR